LQRLLDGQGLQDDAETEDPDDRVLERLVGLLARQRRRLGDCRLPPNHERLAGGAVLLAPDVDQAVRAERLETSVAAVARLDAAVVLADHDASPKAPRRRHIP